MSKAYGSNYFGEWVQDPFDNPAYKYTCDQVNDPRAETPVNHGLLSATDHIHQVGNDRLVAIVSNHGHVQVRQDEGGPKFLNGFAPDRSQFGGGIGYLTDSKETLSTFYTGSSTSFDRVFGMGYFRKTVKSERWGVDQVIQAPFGDDPVVLSQVTITNNTTEELKNLRWVEYWGCHPYQFSFKLYMLAQAQRKSVTDMRRQFGDRFEHSFAQLDARNTGLLERKTYTGSSATENVAWEALKPILAANPTMFAGGAVSEPADDRVSFDDLSPPLTFLASLDAPANAMSTDGISFFGEGGVTDPSGLISPLDGNLASTGPTSAMLLQRNISLAPGESQTLYFLFGYTSNDSIEDVATLIEKYRATASSIWKKSSQQWKFGGMKFITADSWVERETAWNYYYLRSALTYDSYFQEHILTQGAQYVYVLGNNSSSRDPLQHVLPLIYSDPQIVKDILRYTFKMVRPDGSIPYGMVGSGMPMPTIMDDASDIPLYLLWVASEYILATRDVAFLDEQLPTYPLYTDILINRSVFDLLKSAYSCMRQKIGTGEHGLFRQLQDDWNDAIVTLWVDKSNRLECVRDGESVPNSAMASYVFKLYAYMLSYARAALGAINGVSVSAQLSSAALCDAESHRKATMATWTGKWFRRAWLGASTGWIGEKNLWLEPQPWALIGGATDASTAPILIDAIDRMLRQPSTLGAMQQSGVGETMADGGKRPLGMSVNGGIWPALNVTLIWALAQNGHSAMAWDEWKRNSLAYHANVYPDVWYGTWSSLDSVNSALNQRPGRASFSEVFNQEDFPVTNSHVHACALVGITKLLGIEFTCDGLLLSPDVQTLGLFEFESTLLGVRRQDGLFEGWYAPSCGGEWSVGVKLSEELMVGVKKVIVQGREVPLLVDRGRVVFRGVSSVSKPLEWRIELW